MKSLLIKKWEGRGINKQVIEAFTKVKREDFVLKEYKDQAYDDIALPHLKEQTISQPTTIVIMLDALNIKKNDKVLEIGTGSGYNAALIAEIIKPGILYTTEIIKELADFAKEKLKSYNNIKIFNIDGSQGLKKHSPFSKIIVTAACPKIPKQLISQLKYNGILVAPVGSAYHQEMLKITKTKKSLNIKNLGDFIFVPLRGKFGNQPKAL